MKKAQSIPRPKPERTKEHPRYRSFRKNQYQKRLDYCAHHDAHLCELCERENKPLCAVRVELHHIWPRETSPHLELVAWNCVFLCKRHHGIQTKSEQLNGHNHTAKQLYYILHPPHLKNNNIRE